MRNLNYPRLHTSKEEKDIEQGVTQMTSIVDGMTSLAYTSGLLESSIIEKKNVTEGDMHTLVEIRGRTQDYLNFYSHLHIINTNTQQSLSNNQHKNTAISTKYTSTNFSISFYFFSSRYMQRNI
jgi:hypothetical protein